MRSIAVGLLASLQLLAGVSTQPGRSTWLYTQRGTGFGVKGVGLLVGDYQGNVFVLARPSQLVNLEERYEQPAAGLFQPEDRVLAKYDPDQRLLTIQKVGAADFPHICQLVTDRRGDVFGIGYFNGTTTLWIGREPLALTSRGESDVLLLKWTSAGEFVFGRQLGGPGDESACGLALDPGGNIVVCGEFRGEFEVPTRGRAIALSADKRQPAMFLLKLDPQGNGLWARQASCVQDSQTSGSLLPPGTAVDREGNCYLTGGFEPALRFMAEPHSRVVSSRGNWDFFLARYDREGVLNWVRTGGGAEGDYGVRVLIDDAGCSYVTGRFGPEAIFGQESRPVRLTGRGRADMFMACYDPGGALLGALRVGGAGPTIDKHWTVVFDEFGNRYLVGQAADSIKLWPATAVVDPSVTAESTSASAPRKAAGTNANPRSRFENISRQSDGSIQIVLDGHRDGTYLIEISTDLYDWQTVDVLAIRGGRIVLRDEQAAGVPLRFYRVRQP